MPSWNYSLNCDAHRGVQKERKSTFFTAFEHGENEARSLFAAQYWYRKEDVMNITPQKKLSNMLYQAHENGSNKTLFEN